MSATPKSAPPRSRIAFSGSWVPGSAAFPRRLSALWRDGSTAWEHWTPYPAQSNRATRASAVTHHHRGPSRLILSHAASIFAAAGEGKEAQSPLWRRVAHTIWRWSQSVATVAAVLIEFSPCVPFVPLTALCVPVHSGACCVPVQLSGRAHASQFGHGAPIPMGNAVRRAPAAGQPVWSLTNFRRGRPNNDTLSSTPHGACVSAVLQ